MDDEKRESVEKAETLMLKDVLNIIINQAKALPKAWGAMSQEEQQDYIDSAEAQVRASVDACVNVIACQDSSSAMGILEQVVFKGGAAKAVIVFRSANEEVLGLAESTEHMVKIVVIPEFENVIDDSDLPKGEADQRSLGLGEEYADDQKTHEGEPFLTTLSPDADEALADALEAVDSGEPNDSYQEE